MRKIIILIGCPGSGKSTYSSKFVKENDGWVRVGRDNFRYMLKDLPFLQYNLENMVSKLMDHAILTALECNQNVIIDNTNVKLSYINHFRKLVAGIANVEYKIFDVPFKELLQRDSVRDKSVGEEVLNKMYESFYNMKKSFKCDDVSKLGDLINKTKFE